MQGQSDHHLGHFTAGADESKTFRRGESPWLMWAAALTLVLATAGVYANSFHGPMIFDDLSAIRDNPTIRHLWPPGPILHPPGSGNTVQGRPMLNLSFALNYAAGELRVPGYHTTNLAIHILAGLALFGLARRTLLLPALRVRFGSAATGLAWAVALVWLVHPLQTESVTYISQRAEALAGLCYLLTMYAALRGMTGNAAGGFWYAIAVLACAIGMASKETVVSVPLMVLIYDRVFVSASWRQVFQRRWGLYAALAATWILLLGLVWTAGGRGGSAGGASGISPWAYLLMQCGAIVHYLTLAFWPGTLVFDYGTELAHGAAEIISYAAILIALALATMYAFIRHPKLGFLGLIFFATLAPSSSFVPIATQTVAEHRMYLPLAALVALVLIGSYALWQRSTIGRGGNDDAVHAFAWHGLPPLLAVAVIAGMLGGRTLLRNADYRSEEAIWGATVAAKPDNWRAQNWLGLAFLARGDSRSAIRCFDRALALNPHYAEAWANRGGVYHYRHEDSLAVSDYTRALDLDPSSATWHGARGIAYRLLGVYSLALTDLNEAIRLDPTLSEGFDNRSIVERHLVKLDAALADANEAIRISPNAAAFYLTRGNAYQAKGSLPQAIENYDQALRLNPKYVEAYYNRAVCQTNLHEYDRAWADVRQLRALGSSVDPTLLEVLRAATGRTE